MINSEEEKKKEFRTVINKNIQSTVRAALGYDIASKRPFRTKITLQELIEYQFKGRSDEYKFKKFLSMADEIVENVRILFPFINLEGLDLSWTTEEIQETIWGMFEHVQAVTLNDCPKLSKKQIKVKRNPKKKSDLQKELEKKLENEIRMAFRIPNNVKFKRTVTLSDYIKKYIPLEEQDDTFKYINETWEKNKYSLFEKKINSKFEDDLLKIFPKAKSFSINDYTNFSYLMGTIKYCYNL